MKKIVLLLTFILSMVNLNAQTTTADIVKDWGIAEAKTKEYLVAVPESGYSFKPTKEIRCFSDQFLHLSDAI